MVFIIVNMAASIESRYRFREHLLDAHFMVAFHFGEADYKRRAYLFQEEPENCRLCGCNIYKFYTKLGSGLEGSGWEIYQKLLHAAEYTDLINETGFWESFGAGKEMVQSAYENLCPHKYVECVREIEDENLVREACSLATEPQLKESLRDMLSEYEN